MKKYFYIIFVFLFFIFGFYSFKKYLDFKNHLEDKKCQVVVLFCDIRNYTKLCGENKDDDVAGFLKAYFKKICTIILNNGGILHQILGDAVVAVFVLEKDKIGFSNSCDYAVKSALEILKFTKNFDVKKTNLYGLKGNKIKNGVGITFGPVVFARLGIKDIYDRIIVGDVMNLDSRLQDLNKKSACHPGRSGGIYAFFGFVY